MEVPRHWRLRAQRYRLEGSACRVCGQPTFPPRPTCPHCAVLPAIDQAARLAIPEMTTWLTLPVKAEPLQLVS